MFLKKSYSLVMQMLSSQNLSLFGISNIYSIYYTEVFQKKKLQFSDADVGRDQLPLSWHTDTTVRLALLA